MEQNIDFIRSSIQQRSDRFQS